MYFIMYYYLPTCFGLFFANLQRALQKYKQHKSNQYTKYNTENQPMLQLIS